MKIGLGVIIAVGIFVFGCGTKDHSGSNDEISGAYVREYSFKVVNPETGNEIGFRAIRDTIFVNSKQDGYEVSNKKWRLNDYDKEGWQDMEHSDDRPKATFIAEFDIQSHQMISPDSVILHFVMGKSTVFWKLNSDYHKVKR